MRNSRLGCLTPTGIIATLLTALAIVGVAFAQGGVMYSPGPLNAEAGEALGGVTSHAETGRDCNACHAAPWDVMTMADRCVACHTDIAADMRVAASLHGSINHKNPNLKCGHCHPDHRGPDAPLTDASFADFPHAELGFSLRGHPQRVTGEAFVCSDCHTQSISTFNPQDCQTCHQQIDAAIAQAHFINYGADCLACHDGVDRFGKNFAHDVFPFRLDGKHAQASCVSCHTNARVVTDFASAPQDCFSCHRSDDIHVGGFGADCAACHSSEGWTPARFDHNLSAFKLDGAHVSVACADCHRDNVFKGTSSACASCHADPLFHAGLFGTDCAACHTTSVWSPAAFNRRHTFPINHGEGGAVSCVTCHPSNFTTYTCYGCHEHNQFEVQAKHLEEGVRDFENCMACHPTGQEDEGEGGND